MPPISQFSQYELAELLENELRRHNLEVERLLGNLRRIKTSWNSLGLTCDCGPVGSGEACDICEIDFILQDVEDEYA